jgi:hypothetical protein
MLAPPHRRKTASKPVCRRSPPGLPPTWFKQKRIKNDHSNDDDQHETETDTEKIYKETHFKQRRPHETTPIFELPSNFKF